MKLLKSAGRAVQALTTELGTQAATPAVDQSIEKQKKSFTDATTQYFTLLSSIDVHLRHNINALEEANIVPAETSSRDTQNTLSLPSASAGQGLPPNAQYSKNTGSNKGAITGGGLGSLDVGWLNSRNDTGMEMEKDTWQEAERFINKRLGQHLANESRA